MVPTPAQAALIAHIKGQLLADARVHSAWLSGSFGRGEADAWSDIDVIVVVDEDDLAASLKEYSSQRSAMGEALLRRVIFGRLVMVVTPEWQRYDLSFLTPAEFRRQDPTGVIALFKGETPTPRGPVVAATNPPDPDRVLEICTEFLRVLGLGPVGLHRGEWLRMQDGIDLMRGLTIELMLQTNGRSAKRSGALRLNALLTAAQREALEALPPAKCDPTSLLAAIAELARLFLPLGREVSRIAHVEWPEAFEQATLAHIRREMGLDL